jgi:hypothetical protein
MKVYDNYEISPCRRYEEPDSPGKFYFEVCDTEEADVWTLYGHIPGEGVQAIGDFSKREYAEETFQRIIGIPFGGHDEIAARLRLMHAGPELQTASNAVIAMLDQVLAEIRSNEGLPGWWVQLKLIESLLADTALNRLRVIIAEATGRAA